MPTDGSRTRWMLACLWLAWIAQGDRVQAQSQQFTNTINNGYNAIGGTPIPIPAGTCAANCDSAPSAASAPTGNAGGGLTPQQKLLLEQQVQRQQMMNHAAGQLGAAIGQEMGKVLFGDPQEEAARQAQAAAAAQAAVLAKERAATQAQDTADRLQGAVLMGTGGDTSDALSWMTGTTNDLPLMPAPGRAPQNSADEGADMAMHQQAVEKALAALDCAMQDVYERARFAGDSGRQFASQLQGEIAAYKRQAIQPANGTNQNDVGISVLNLDRQFSVGAGAAGHEGQFVVNAVVANHGDGLIRVIVDSHLAGARGEASDDRQASVSIGKDGKASLDDGISPEMGACIGR